MDLKTLEWYAVIESPNAKSFKKINIFHYSNFIYDLEKVLSKHPTKEALSSELRYLLKYYFASKCEYEIIISSWPPDKIYPLEEKVDVFDQINLNWDNFVDYIWQHCFAIAVQKD